MKNVQQSKCRIFNNQKYSKLLKIRSFCDFYVKQKFNLDIIYI